MDCADGNQLLAAVTRYIVVALARRDHCYCGAPPKVAELVVALDKDVRPSDGRPRTRDATSVHLKPIREALWARRVGLLARVVSSGPREAFRAQSKTLDKTRPVIKNPFTRNLKK